MRIGAIIFILAFTLVALVYGVNIYTTNHEAAHQEIYRQHGMTTNTTINFFGILGAETVTTNGVACDQACIQENNMNEIVGYNIRSFVDNLWLMLIVVIGFIIIRDIERVKSWEAE